MTYLFLILHPVGVPAHPPIAVSHSSKGRFFPTRYIPFTISSNGIVYVTPLSANPAEVKAFATPITLRVWQGDSTSPAIGSHTSHKSK